MAAIDRTTIKRGPAAITFKGVTIHSRGDAKLDFEKELFEVESQTLPTADQRIKSQKFMLDFVPDGRVTFDPEEEGDILGVLYECAGYTLGQSVFGGSDSPVVVHWKLDGDKLTFPAGGITKPPDLLFSGAAPLFASSCQLTMPGKNNTAWSDAAKFVTASNSSYTEEASYGDIITESPTVAWGGTSPWSAINTKDGVKVSFDLSLQADEEDAMGMFDMIFGGLKVTASFTPRGGITVAQLLTAAALQGSGARRGNALNAASLGALNVSNSAAYFRLYGASLTKFPLAAGKTTDRIGELTLVNTLSTDPNQVFYIGTSAPA